MIIIWYDGIPAGFHMKEDEMHLYKRAASRVSKSVAVHLHRHPYRMPWLETKWLVGNEIRGGSTRIRLLITVIYQNKLNECVRVEMMNSCDDM